MFAVWRSENIVCHGVQVRHKKAQWFEFNMPEGAYLVNLKYANKRALAAAIKYRTEVANGPGKRLSGRAWREVNSSAMSSKVCRVLRGMRHVAEHLGAFEMSPSAIQKLG